MSDTVQIEVWVQVDEDGDWSCGKAREDLDNAAGATRLVKVKLTVPRPKPVELVAEIEEEPATGELKAA